MSAETYVALQEAIEAHVADTLELDVLHCQGLGPGGRHERAGGH